MNRFGAVIWSELVNCVRSNNNIVYTLSHHKANVIEQVSDEGFLVTTQSEPQLVRKTWVEDAWNAFEERASLRANDIPGHTRHRSSFIMGLFSLLPSVTVLDTSPVTIKWTEETDKFGAPATWIFQGNPNKFYIDSYLTDRQFIWWSLRQKHYEKEVRIGDIVWHCCKGSN
ncbi:MULTISPECIES: hypothetical protein [unclassified Paenibacillus]|uniref:hypothetical protein n=1 Tax=unclassified Paenibacillus TaxID=185978 RepID=UPI0024076332|nr:MULTISPECIES: hypothetical protein [unclassified Paenibacillus]MDF9841773.1 hypothetical protein [Paenibacillus sp. PastF-2]MDF9848546.1 hypothetical protein [Paenibacillus sp. PastM-2]MDF9854932.1 hypothetical protein [Paenibacillus sp. PastF-1]MDH6480202.1 hypothetical protein [Paenibacillus sp. PastH-2]MDH6507814.1 hypothetical protein [Paenibacillus sp. PastM-3]